MTPGELVGVEAVKAFILAGNAYITIVSNNTGVRFTFRIQKPKTEKEGRPVRFVNVLTGPDNENDYRYIGLLSGSQSWKLFASNKSISLSAPSQVAFSWFWNNILNNKLTGIKVYHAGRCGKCGRTLTVPESVTSGYGPECIKMVNVA